MRRKYKNPPVLEALCEIFFIGDEWDSALLGSFYERVRDTYPKKQEVTHFNVEMRLAPGEVNSQRTSTKPLMRYFKADGSQLVQLAENLLTVNQLKPYCGYDDFKKDIERAIETYFAVVVPKRVERVGVRYINHIIIPANTFDLGEYFKLLPGVPEEVTTVIKGFMTRVDLVALHPQHEVYATLGNTPQKDEGTTTIFLDLYDTTPMHNNDSVESILGIVNEAHENIEHVFEGVITDKARALFEEVRDEHSRSDV